MFPVVSDASSFMHAGCLADLNIPDAAPNLQPAHSAFNSSSPINLCFVGSKNASLQTKTFVHKCIHHRAPPVNPDAQQKLRLRDPAAPSLTGLSKTLVAIFHSCLALSYVSNGLSGVKARLSDKAPFPLQTAGAWEPPPPRLLLFCPPHPPCPGCVLSGRPSYGRSSKSITRLGAQAQESLQMRGKGTAGRRRSIIGCVEWGGVCVLGFPQHRVPTQPSCEDPGHSCLPAQEEMI